jgi:hypothetical protein
LYQVWQEEKARQDREESQDESPGKIQRGIGKGLPSHFPQIRSRSTFLLVTLLEA